MLGAMYYVHYANCELDALECNRCNALFTEVCYVPWPPSASIKEQDGSDWTQIGRNVGDQSGGRVQADGLWRCVISKGRYVWWALL